MLKFQLQKLVNDQMDDWDHYTITQNKNHILHPLRIFDSPHSNYSRIFSTPILNLCYILVL